MTNDFKRFAVCAVLGFTIFMIALIGITSLGSYLDDIVVTEKVELKEQEDQVVSDGYWTERLRVVAKPDHDVRILHDSAENVYYLVVGTSRGLAITPMIDSEGKPISDLHPDADV